MKTAFYVLTSGFALSCMAPKSFPRAATPITSRAYRDAQVVISEIHSMARLEYRNSYILF